MARMSTLKLAVAAAGLLLAAPLLAARTRAAADRPNIVFILVDDLRWDAMGSTGHPFSKTPNIDRIASEGANFKNAFVTTPLCSPSRASFLTGRYVHSHGVQGNGDNNARSHTLVTFPRLLHDAGYETGYFGKWHMGNDDTPRPGFDRWVSFKGQGQHVDPALNIDGKAEKVAGYMTDILTDHVVSFLKQPREKSFCVYLAYKAVHGPFVPAERHRGLYTDPPIVRGAGAKDTNAGKPALTRPIPGTAAPGPGTGSGEPLIRNQLRMLAGIDEGVGRILQALADTKQLDRTMVVFTSDNGYFWGEHGLGDKRWAYEESIRVPLLVRYPPLVAAGLRPAEPALNIDMAPTFLQLAAVPVPQGVQGSSLLPLFKPGPHSWRQAFLAEYFAEPQYPRAPTWQAARSADSIYIRYPDLAGMDELYDLKQDPDQLKNVIADPAYQATLARMKETLAQLLRESSGSG